jgi:hypothetical protein
MSDHLLQLEEEEEEEEEEAAVEVHYTQPTK